ncbi:hypothetical protein TNCV_4456321 [Trichonephila clavipes]|nr:hypothetical protein TNCV_4456321 [Trichonephila clavipes]
MVDHSFVPSHMLATKYLNGRSACCVEELPRRYGDVEDLSRDGLLSRRANGVGTKTKDAGCRPRRLPIRNYCGRGRGPRSIFRVGSEEDRVIKR